MKQKIFLGIGIVVLAIFGISIYNEFMTNHTYYYTMFTDRNNWKIIFWALAATSIPVIYLIKNKNLSLKNLMLKRLPAGLVVFAVAHTVIKETIFGSTGFIILCINTLIIYFLSIYFILGSLSIGTWISNKLIKFTQTRRQEMFINFGIGLGTFLLLIKVLLIADALFGVISWLIFLGFGVAIYFSKKHLNIYKEQVESMLTNFKESSLKKYPLQWIGLILIIISIIYYFLGFQLSFIPYSTAWDANHEYMYIPKILAANHGVLRGNVGPGSAAPLLRHSFISFWFSLAGSLKKFRIGPDTIAVAMNFISGIFVLLLGLGTIKEIINYFSPANKEENEETQSKSITFYAGWFLLLLWLTSGMGAFLVFVDNKTDLGVMSITILAILSGFIFLNYLKEHKGTDTKQALKYIAISGAFFALASMSKQTAFMDIVLFGLLLVSLWINNIIAIGLGILIIGTTGMMKVGNAADLMTTTAGKWVALIGAIVALIGVIQLFIDKKQENYRKNLSKSFKYIGIRLGAFLAILIVFKGPHLVYSQIKDGSFGIGNFGKSIILGKTSPTTLLASSGDIQQLTAQTQIDQTSKTGYTPAQCQVTSFSKEELQKDIKSATVGNEDVGRYVGYGWKELDKGGLSLGYGLLRLFYPSDNTCYGLNHDAKLLCKNSTAVDTFNIQILQGVFAQMHAGSQAYTLLSGALQKFYQKGFKATDNYNPAEFRDQIVSLRQFYQSHAIKTEPGKIFVPYRYIIPLNISFNWSLQNLSSYYTDIGFIWIFAMICILLALAYGIVKKDKTLITISTISMIGWALWWIIGGGILWYGMGLIVWTILATIMYIHQLIDDNKQKNENMLYIFLFLFAIWGVIQLFFNLVRIASQGAGGPFARYKMNIGKTIEIDDTMQQKEVLKNGYGWKDVFDMQFPHYNKFIDYVKNRKNTDGILIAGTYIQYFLANQRNIRSDGMLGRFWEQTSDNDDCKSIKRLENNNIKYLVIDPNIGTVGMGEGNESLFQRFFAKLDPITGKIQEHGAISMLVKLSQDGYLKFFGSNNLGTKYAFTLDDASIKAGFGANLSAEDLIYTRAKLAIARYFQDANTYINFIATTFSQRIQNGLAIGDIADVFGKTIDETKVINAAKALTSGSQITAELIQSTTKTLTQDEKLVLSQYLGILNLSKTGGEQFQSVINNLLGQSLGGGSQLMIFERI